MTALMWTKTGCTRSLLYSFRAKTAPQLLEAEGDPHAHTSMAWATERDAGSCARHEVRATALFIFGYWQRSLRPVLHVEIRLEQWEDGWVLLQAFSVRRLDSATPVIAHGLGAVAYQSAMME